MTKLARPAVPDLDPQRLFGHLAGARGLILAVSGGADSTALMALVARWSPRPPVLVVSVDHGVRSEAAAEVRQVAANAAQLGLAVRIMSAGPRGPGNLQDWARRARYACLVQAAEEAGFDTVLMAHHRDDQAETLLLRLARGSGVYGLAGMRVLADLDGVAIARPLLHLSRKVLAELAEASGLPVSADPSNTDTGFARVRVRKLLPELAAHGLSAERLVQTAGHLARAAAALDHCATSLLGLHAAVDRFGVLRMDAAPFRSAHEEVGLRLLARIVQAIGGAEHTPPFDRLASLYEASTGVREVAAIRRTLHGAVIEAEAGGLTVRREWGRKGPPVVPVGSGATIQWDRRFSVQAPDLPGELSVGPLGASVGRVHAAGAGAAQLRTLPALFVAGQVVAVPEGVSVEDASAPLPTFPAYCTVARRLGLDTGEGVKHGPSSDEKQP